MNFVSNVIGHCTVSEPWRVPENVARRSPILFVLKEVHLPRPDLLFPMFVAISANSLKEILLTAHGVPNLAREGAR